MSAPQYPPMQGYPNGALQVTPTRYTPNPALEETKVSHDVPHQLSRTPSPTPSETKELATGAIDWRTISKPKFWIRREWLWFYVAFGVGLIVTALVTIYHQQIVDKLTPATNWLHDLKFGWLVPIGILFVISFPPLFGHEIVAILCGLVWGLWIGFGIVAAGTFLGEVGNFYAFKYCCRARGEKMEKTNLTYACLARITRDGGFKIALIARLSAIPGHFTTAIFSTCGMNIFVFSLAAILSLPKQFITVYLGVILKDSKTGVKDTKSTIVSDVVLALTVVITILACWYILKRMNEAKPQVIYERRKARQAKLERSGYPYTYPAGTSSTDAFDPRVSDSEIPLNSSIPQYAPQPYRPQPSTFLQRDLEAGPSQPIYTHERLESSDTVGWAEPSYVNPSSHLPLSGAMKNPHSPEAHRRGFGPQMHQADAQTPTQVSFVQGLDTGMVGQQPYGAAEPQSPFDDAYAAHSFHSQQPTDATFHTAYASSPVEMESANPYTRPYQLHDGGYGSPPKPVPNRGPSPTLR